MENYFQNWIILQLNALFHNEMSYVKINVSFWN